LEIKDFRLLSTKEENELSITEKKEYYKKLREYVKNRPLKVTTKGATTIAPKLKGITNKIAEIVTKILSSKNVEWICDGKENIPNETVIFAHTHQSILDGFLWIPKTDRHCIILHSANTKKLLLLCQMNTGLILVKKGNKENNLNAKLDMINLLLNGHSIAYFPEGAWNLSPNKLHLPMSYGFLDIARKSNVPVVPVIHELTYASTEKKEIITKIHTRFGTPIYISPEDNIKQKLEEYKETISTIRYSLIEEKGIFKRKNISQYEYKNYLEGNLKNLKMGNIDINIERKNLFNYNDDFYRFHHINDVPCDENGILLDTDEVQKIKILNSKNNI